MSAKVKRFRGQWYRDRTYNQRWLFEAKDQYGWTGLGTTPARAILDLRHEYRQMNDSAELGKCKQGRFHPTH